MILRIFHVLIHFLVLHCFLSAGIGIFGHSPLNGFSNPIESAINSFSQFVGSVNENISYRKSSAAQYRDKLRRNVENMFESFRSSQAVLSQQTQHEFELYLNQLNQIYSDTLTALHQQRNYIQELEKNIPTRPKQIDESLERFLKFYDESIVQKIVTQPKPGAVIVSPKKPLLPKLLKRPRMKRPSRRVSNVPDLQKKLLARLPGKKVSSMQKLRNSIRKYVKSSKSKDENLFRDVTRGIEETSASFSNQMDLLAVTLGRQWSYLTQSIQDMLGSDHATGEGGLVGSQLQLQMVSLLNEFSVFQEDISARASDLLRRSQQAIDDSANKADLLREKLELERQLRTLERAVNAWVEEKFTTMETRVKALQDKLKISNSLYEELVGKRQAEAEYSQMNDATLRRILGLIDPSDEGWKFISGESGIQVYRKFFRDGPSRECACVMANGTINSPPHKVMELLSDTSRVREYNSLFDSGKEVATVTDDTKILWVFTPPIFPLKPRDFCMVWHVRKLKDGTCVVLNRAVEHPSAPITRDYVRATLVLGASIIQPVPGDARRSRLTMITQLNPGGFAPPSLVNFLCTVGPIGFMKNVEVASKRPPSRA